MWKNNKFTTWYDNQNETTKAWLDKQAIWHGKDMWMAFGAGILFGFLLGLIVSV